MMSADDAAAVADATASTAAAAAATAPYVPSPMDPSVIYSQVAVMGVSGAAFYFWWSVLVPARRTALAKEKRDRDDGSLGGYLEELREEDRRVAAAALAATEGGLESGAAVDGAVGDVAQERVFERWLLRDWLSDQSQQKAAALPFLPKAKFNSGDNPILVATALIMVTGVVSSVLERF